MKQFKALGRCERYDMGDTKGVQLGDHASRRYQWALSGMHWKNRTLYGPLLEAQSSSVQEDLNKVSFSKYNSVHKHRINTKIKKNYKTFVYFIRFFRSTFLEVHEKCKNMGFERVGRINLGTLSNSNRISFLPSLAKL